MIGWKSNSPPQEGSKCKTQPKIELEDAKTDLDELGQCKTEPNDTRLPSFPTSDDVEDYFQALPSETIDSHGVQSAHIPICHCGEIDSLSSIHSAYPICTDPWSEIDEISQAKTLVGRRTTTPDTTHPPKWPCTRGKPRRAIIW